MFTGCLKRIGRIGNGKNMPVAILFAFFFSFASYAQGQADISVSTDFSFNTYYSGDNVTFAISATNFGPDIATGVLITEMLPPNATFISAIPGPGAGSYNQLTNVWSIDSILPDSADTLYLTIRPNIRGSYRLTSLKIGENQTDPESYNDISIFILTVYASADLSVQKEIYATNGDTITFAVYAKNAGPDTATNVNVFDKLPDYFTYLSSYTHTGAYSSVAGIWSIGTLLANHEDTLYIIAIADTSVPNVRTTPAQITYEFSSPQQPTDFDFTYGVPQFFPQLGTLIKVIVEQNGTLVTNIKMENTGGTTPRGSKVKLKFVSNASLGLSGPDFSSLTDNFPTYKDSFNATAYDGLTDFAGTSGHNFGLKTFSAKDSFTLTTGLAPYIGSRLVNFIDSAKDYIVISGPPGNLVTITTTTAGTHIYVVYYYLLTMPFTHLTNVATIGGDQYDPNPSNNVDTVSTHPHTPLPVELVNFDAAEKDKQVQLTWTTASEINNDHFEIQRSTDGSNFEEIGRVAGFGTSFEIHNYNFTDDNPPANVLYYRLKQVDLNGNYTYSTIVRVEMNNAGRAINTPSVNAYPIPVSSKGRLNVALENFGGTASVKMVDMAGRVIYSENIETVQSATSTIQFPLQGLRSGIYLIMVYGNDNSYSAKVLIQN